KGEVVGLPHRVVDGKQIGWPGKLIGRGVRQLNRRLHVVLRERNLGRNERSGGQTRDQAVGDAPAADPLSCICHRGTIWRFIMSASSRGSPDCPSPCPTSRKSCPRSKKENRKLPSGCCRSCTASCASWRRSGWRRRGRGRRCRPRRWC